MAALVLAPLVPAVILSVLIFRNPIWGLGAALLVCPVTVGLGTPAYFLLRLRVAPTSRNAAVAGGLFAAVLATWFLAQTTPPPGDVTYGFVTAVDGAWTWAGRTFLSILVVIAFCVGATGGLVFRWVVGGRHRQASP